MSVRIYGEYSIRIEIGTARRIGSTGSGSYGVHTRPDGEWLSGLKFREARDFPSTEDVT